MLVDRDEVVPRPRDAAAVRLRAKAKGDVKVAEVVTRGEVEEQEEEGGGDVGGQATRGESIPVSPRCFRSRRVPGGPTTSVLLFLLYFCELELE